jgi:hypothetical protein
MSSARGSLDAARQSLHSGFPDIPSLSHHTPGPSYHISGPQTVTRNSTIVLDFNARRTWTEEIIGIPSTTSTPTDFQDRVAGLFLEYMKDQLPWGLMMSGVGPVTVDYLNWAAERYNSSRQEQDKIGDYIIYLDDHHHALTSLQMICSWLLQLGRWTQ